MVDTKYGKSPVGSFSSYQLSHTESNFDVYINVEPAVQRIETDTNNPQINQFPHFPLQNQGESEERNLGDDKKEFVNRLKLDEDEINALEGATRDQASSELCRSECQFRFTASNFHLISHRKRNHQNFANTLIHP